MRVAVLAGCLAMTLGLAGPSLAQASFQHVKDSGPTPVYWDAASLKRAGDTFEVDVLQIYKMPAGKPLEGGVTRYRLSCVWTATVGGTLGNWRIGETGRVLSQSGPEPFAQGSFYGPHGWQALLVPVVCDSAWKPGKGLTAAQAFADAKARMAIKAPKEPDPKRAAAAPADTVPARFAVIRKEAATGNMAFIDWSRITRQGDKATVQTFDILGDDTPPPPEPQWLYSVFDLRTLDLDCKARTLTQTVSQSFSKYFEPGFPDGMVWPVRTAKDWPLGADILDAVCSGAEPTQTFASRAAAIAHQRSFHPLRKAGG
ncbi:MAG: hypothetical protein R3C46_15215 [Hyphomonadaceae bacterium]